MRSARQTLQCLRLTRPTSIPRLLSPRPSVISRSQSKRFYAELRSEQPRSEKTDDTNADPKKQYKEDTSPPPDPNKSPFQVFVDTFKSELSKSRELQESVKALQDESGRLGDSEALRRAKEAYTKAKVAYNVPSG